MNLPRASHVLILTSVIYHMSWFSLVETGNQIQTFRNVYICVIWAPDYLNSECVGCVWYCPFSLLCRCMMQAIQLRKGETNRPHPLMQFELYSEIIVERECQFAWGIIMCNHIVLGELFYKRFSFSLSSNTH